MPKSKDKVINEMRKIAVCKPEPSDLPSLLALAASLNFLLTHANHSLYHDFVQIICRPSNFSLSYEQLPDICHYNEKPSACTAKNMQISFSKNADTLNVCLCRCLLQG